MGFLGALQLLFIGLKLTGFINWSWFLVLTPTLLPVILLIVLGLITYLLQ